MTRDEAIKIIEKLRDTTTTDEPGALLDCFIDLGMLKLNATYPNGEPLPSGKIGRVIAFMNDFGLSRFSPGELDRALERAGLKIVEA